MSNVFSASMPYMVAAFKGNAGETGIYARGPYQIPDLIGTRGDNSLTLDSSMSVRIEADEVDWIVAAADLVINGQPTLPLRGDKYTVNGETFQVMPRGNNLQPFSNEATGQQIRIHTKKVA